VRTRLLLLLALAIALAAPDASAAAESELLLPPFASRHLLTQVGAPVPPEREFRSGFVVEAGHGYKLGVSTFGTAIILEVIHGGRKTRSETAYVARGVAKPERLQATFGKFGKISMRFRESRNRTWVGKRRTCHGSQQFVKRRGVFVGSLRFRGEDGYVSAQVHRAKGAIVSIAAKCLHQHRGRSATSARSSSYEPPSFLIALGRDGLDTTDFLSLHFRKKSVFLAMHEEGRGKLTIVRLALCRSSTVVHVNEAVTSAHLSPPAPYHGTGRYRAAPDGTTTWGGNLSVNFPGRPRFPLTGPQFEVFLDVPF
jgi:hypothetical protein